MSIKTEMGMTAKNPKEKERQQTLSAKGISSSSYMCVLLVQRSH